MLIDQGLSLMLYGMGTVFVFLTILVFATLFMSRMVQRFAPVPEAIESAAVPAGTASPLATNPSPKVTEAIRLALVQHRR